MKQHPCPRPARGDTAPRHPNPGPRADHTGGAGQPRRGALALLLLPALALLPACATRAPGPGETAPRGNGAAAPVGASVPAAPASPGAAASAARDQAALETERDWLQQWFKGTPVNIVHNADTLSVDVPREFAFDVARSQVKPPLAAVLDSWRRA